MGLNWCKQMKEKNIVYNRKGIGIMRPHCFIDLPPHGIVSLSGVSGCVCVCVVNQGRLALALNMQQW